MAFWQGASLRGEVFWGGGWSQFGAGRGLRAPTEAVWDRPPMWCSGCELRLVRMSSTQPAATFRRARDQITVVLADDHEVVRRGLRGILQQDSRIIVVGEAESGLETVELCRHLRPTVGLLDIRLGRDSGIDVARSIRRWIPDTRILVLSAYGNPRYVRAMIKLGATGYVLKDSIGAQIRTAVRTVAGGGHFFNSEVSMSGGSDSPTAPLPTLGQPDQDRASEQAPLTERETEVLRKIASGFRNTDMARELGISMRTVETHVQHILVKLAVRTRTQAALEAMQRGLV